MKTLLAIAVGVTMLVSVGIHTISGEGQIQATSSKTQSSALIQSSKKEEAAGSTDIKKLPEYETLAKNVKLANYNPKILEDSRNKRVILLKDGTGLNRYKSVYIKKESRLKIIDYRSGQIFNDYIKIDTNDASSATPQETKPSISDTIAKLPEYKALASKVNLSGYSAQIMEDNRGKRIVLFMDSNEKKKYKTIYIKQTGIIKIINL